MRYFSLLLIFIFLIVPVHVGAQSASPEIRLIVDGKKIDTDVMPVIINGRTLVPVRVISELNGAEVEWNEKTRKVTISSEDVYIRLVIDSTEAVMNGKVVTLDEGATIISDRTMVPVRFISESFGYTVGWVDETKTVTLTSPSDSDESTVGNAMLNTIGGADTEKGYRVTIKFNSSMTGEFSIFTLDNPARVIIDIENAKIDYTKQFDFNNDIVKAARVGNHDKYLRVAIDLAVMSEYTTYVNEAKDAVVLFFDVPVTNPGETEKLPEEEEEKERNPDEITVVIDAGHGGSDPGAIGKEGEVAVAYESEVNLSVSKIVRDILEEAGINVVMTRDEDEKITLGKRCEISNEAEADLFVSIHSNAMDSGHEDISGTMVFYGMEKDTEKPWVKSRLLASNILSELTEALETVDRGIQNGDQLAVIKGTDAPAVLVELAFITNPEDREKLTDPKYQKKAAEAIALGILNTLE